MKSVVSTSVSFSGTISRSTHSVNEHSINEHSVNQHVISTDLVKTSNLNTLHIACRNNDVQSVRQILTFDNNYNDFIDVQEDITGNTPLHIAVVKKSIRIIKLLLNAGCNTNLKNNIGLTPLHIACNIKHVTIIKTILATNSSSVNTPDKGGRTPLHIVCSNQNIPILILLLGTPNISINIKDEHGYTPLNHAVFSKNTKSVEMLLRNNANIGSQDNNNNNVLHHCTTNKIMEILLKDMFTKINVSNIFTTSTITYTLDSLTHAANIIISQNKDGDTPLHTACQRHCSSNMVKTLLKTMSKIKRLLLRLYDPRDIFNFDIDQKNNKGNTVFHIACQQARSNVDIDDYDAITVFFYKMGHFYKRDLEQ